MRSYFTNLLTLVLLLNGSADAGGSKTPSPAAVARHFASKNSVQSIPSGSQRALLDADVNGLTGRYLQASGKEAVTIQWDDVQGIPIFVRVPKGVRVGSSITTVATAQQVRNSALQYLRTNATLLRVKDPATEFQEIGMATDELGYSHLRYDQRYRGVEVWGRDIRVHVNPDGSVESFNGRYVPTPPDRAPDVVEVAVERARSIALDRFGSPGTVTGERMVYLPGDAGGLQLCWLVSVAGRLDQRKDMFVEASTGVVVKEYNRVVMDGPVTGSGLDVKGVTRSLNLYQIGSQYYMLDVSKPMYNAAQSTLPNDGKGVLYAFDARNGDANIFQITSANQNSWTVRPGVSALYTSGKVYDYYKSVYGRNAIDNQGGTMNAVVNYQSNYNNAFWNGQYMVFGNGDGTEFSDLTGAADVTAHEMTHGITEWTANLVYENQSGALNESFSDIFGTLFEFWLEGAGGDWLMGEDVFTPATAGDALRSMSDPGGAAVPAGSRQPSTMSQYVNLPNTQAGDFGGVHTNSGIPNKAFYLFATASGVTKEDAGNVYYRALTTYMTKNSQFVDCRLAVIKAAEDLFGGPGNAKALAAAAAFDAVGITTGTGTGKPPVDPPVQGTQYLALVDAVTGRLYRWTIGTNTFAQLSSGALFSRPAVTDNGVSLFYVDMQHNVHVVKSDGTGDQALSTSGGFNNLAVSRSGRYLAATTVFSEPKIYLFDLQNSAGNKVLQLHTPSYQQGETAGSIRYPDRIDWTADETRIMYDAFNTVVLSGGDTLGYWDINTVRVADGSVSRLFPSQPRGIDIGNAVFASNTDNLIALDYSDATGQVQVLAVNLNTGDAGVVTNNYTSLGSPSFSVDDQKVYYHYIDDMTGTYQVWSVSLGTDGITGGGNDKMEVDGAVYPLAFAVGTRATDVSAAESVPSVFGLGQNYPNPFNPSTLIGYQVPGPGSMRVRLAVFDVLGREVAVLVDENKAPGNHTVQFNATGLASGVYLYRMTVEDPSGSAQVYKETRKLLLLR